MSATTPTANSAPGKGPTRRAAPRPSGSGRIGAVGPVLALLLAALGVLLGREGLTGLGWVAANPWFVTASDSLDGFTPPGWVVPAGLFVALVGLWLIVTALARRSRRTIALSSTTGVHLGVRDVARLASGAARDVDGVVSVSSTATRRTVRVTVDALGSEGVQEEVTAVVRHQLAPLDPTPTLTVDVRVGGGRRRGRPTDRIDGSET